MKINKLLLFFALFTINLSMQASHQSPIGRAVQLHPYKRALIKSKTNRGFFIITSEELHKSTLQLERECQAIISDVTFLDAAVLDIYCSEVLPSNERNHYYEVDKRLQLCKYLTSCGIHNKKMYSVLRACWLKSCNYDNMLARDIDGCNKLLESFNIVNYIQNYCQEYEYDFTIEASSEPTDVTAQTNCLTTSSSPSTASEHDETEGFFGEMDDFKR